MKKSVRHQHVHVLRYATIAIVGTRFKFTLAVTCVSREDRPEDVVRRLLDMVPGELKVKGVLLDKGFYNANVLNEVGKDTDYLVPVKKFEGMKITYRIAEITDKWRWDHTLNGGKENEHKTTVYLQEVGMDDYIGMVTNKDMSMTDVSVLFDVYRKRWNVENSYKEKDNYRIKTNSRNHSYRILIYTISHLLVNLLTITKRKNKTTITHDDMKHILEYLLNAEPGTTKRLTKKLIILS
ncbi:transposase [Methanooceanicella nereidis]|nr:transposase [Methanocella sp. CWC-04]